MMNGLRAYKNLPMWDAQTLPKGFRKKHNTREGTWARLTVHAGTLRFTFLSEEDEVLSSQIVDDTSGPLLVEPGAWHKVEPLGDELRCQLSFLCEPTRYFEKKHKLTAPHSEVIAVLDALKASTGRAVLDLGSGRGRNSLFLHEHGFEVTAVDRSEAAITTLREIQKAEGLEFLSSVYDINDATLAKVLSDDEVDHVISTVVFQFLDAARVPSVIEDIQTVTRPGGLHLIVAPVTSEEMPCPIAFPFTFKPNELRDYYQDWEIVLYKEHEGEFHKRDEQGERYKSLFATIVARKPLQPKE